MDVFYREAGPADAPVVLLLHGFPTSSHMFRNLIPQLADRYHVIAPDFPGFGQSDAPDHKDFKYGFGAYADIVDELVSDIGVQSYAMYVMDYGAPVGYRLALKHPERVTALIIQNGNAYDEGLPELWEPIKAYWTDGSSIHRDEVNAADYDAILIPGGLGPMVDIQRNREVQSAIVRAWTTSKIVSAVCHGPCSLLGVDLGDGTPFVRGKKVTGFSKKEEYDYAREDVPFELEDALTGEGAIYSSAANWEPHVVVDGRLITGQNPASAGPLAQELLAALRKQG
ncbi:alpha/beta fold hydrolase [Rhizobium lentis]|uniref:alpha/beta fold hydrolase n=1 Tax=Rhizobium lentis TaxID=1138194 RepID=UPI00287FA2B4|nr:alpha/beta fold hydrolase [Rhizobium lentis]